VLDDGRGLEQRRAEADAGDTLTYHDSLGSCMIRASNLKEFRDSLIPSGGNQIIRIRQKIISEFVDFTDFKRWHKCNIAFNNWS